MDTRVTKLMLIRIERGVPLVKPAEQAVAQALASTMAAGPSKPAQQAGAQKPSAAVETQLASMFERQVEQCLRHLSQYAWLGQSELALGLLIEGANAIERGKAVREILLDAVECLRPAGTRPGGAQRVPPEWYGYAILYDAYIADVPNRDIMSRLYISEGTFNRRRRAAMHAVASALLEAKRLAQSAAQTQPPQVGRPLQPWAARHSPTGWPMGQGANC
jgi:hypothetical protein